MQCINKEQDSKNLQQVHVDAIILKPGRSLNKQHGLITKSVPHVVQSMSYIYVVLFDDRTDNQWGTHCMESSKPQGWNVSFAWDCIGR